MIMSQVLCQQVLKLIISNCIISSSSKSFILLAIAAPNNLIRQSTSVSSNPAAKFGGHAIWSDLEGWRRNKRDIEDRLVLASRRAAIRRRHSDGSDEVGSGKKNEDEDFAIDDGNEDAWVHDGVDDIHIDPETKRAASELSQDESSSIDAEYEPNGGGGSGGSGGGQGSESPPVVNRTRVTTISEVIPMSNSDEIDSVTSNRGPADESSLGHRIQLVATAALPNGPHLPASYLTLDQVQRLIEAQQRNNQEEPEEE